MQKTVLQRALEKAELTPEDLDYILAGDLLNQCIGSSFGLRDFRVPFYGPYGACPTQGNSLSLASLLIDGGYPDRAAPLTAKELARCDAVRKELGTQFCRRCGYCAPCPNGIDIPSNFLMANYARKYGLAGWAEQRYKAMPYHAGSCVMCGACEKRCPYGLPIRDMLEGVAKVFGY